MYLISFEFTVKYHYITYCTDNVWLWYRCWEMCWTAGGCAYVRALTDVCVSVYV